MSARNSVWLNVVAVLVVLTGVFIVVLPFLGIYHRGGQEALLAALGPAGVFGWIALLVVAAILVIWQWCRIETLRFTVSAGSLALVLLIVGLVWCGIVGYTRENSRVTRDWASVDSCRHTLDEVGTAIASYRKFHNGQLPETLEMIVTDQPQEVERPWHGRGPADAAPHPRRRRMWASAPATGLATQPAQTQPYRAPRADFAYRSEWHCSCPPAAAPKSEFIYRSVPNPNKTTLIAWDAEPHVIPCHVMRCRKTSVRNVLFADGRTQTLDEAEFQKLVAGPGNTPR
jgi:hypothetical protein